MTTLGLELVLIGVLLALSAFFSSSETALFSLRPHELRKLEKQPSSRSLRVVRILKDPHRFLVTVLVGNTLVNVAATSLGTSIVTRHLDRNAVAASVGMMTFLILLLGEVTPKNYALNNPVKLSVALSPLVSAVLWLLGPLKGPMEAFLRLLLRPGGQRPPARAAASGERVTEAIALGRSQGVVDAFDWEVVKGLFKVMHLSVENVMTPRTGMVAFEAGDTVEAAADVVARAGRSRYPVYQESLDEIVGVVHAKDLLAALRHQPGSSVRGIMRPPLFVPGTREVEDVLADMKRLKVHLAVVLDEYGGTAGLVTMEDLLEEIVGPIYDEHDAPTVSPGEAAGAPVLDGSMTIGEFNEAHTASLDDTHYTTLGGFLFGQLGRLPRVGDRVTGGGRTFEIVEMEGRRVKSVRLV